MNVLIYTEISKGKIRKSSLEAVNYGAAIAAKSGGSVTALMASDSTGVSLDDLGKAGASRVLVLEGASSISHDSGLLAAAVAKAAENAGAELVVFSHDLSGKAVGPRVAVRLHAGFVPGAIDYPNTDGGAFRVTRNVFSGKASAVYEIKTARKVISLLPNSFQVKLEGTAVAAESFVSGSDGSRIKIKETKVVSGELSLPEAETVVSAGRGLKGPENWGMVEALAKELGAATACSRPVADIGWRPHHEHVGQTGLAIRPNLYFAIGISGAIQHLAGVNGSKTIVVINKDPEAPFFKSADYGIVGDAFEVLPKLLEAVKKFKASQH
jgi:electron transfer flavoprotein alpha subunit